MVSLAIYASMEAKPGKEAEVEAFLRSAVPLVEAEPGTIAWFAIRTAPNKFGIFDVFENEAGRQAHRRRGPEQCTERTRQLDPRQRRAGVSAAVYT